jgi:putative membrane protein
MAVFFAFLHHIAAFALVSALAIELVTLRQELTVRSARTLLVADLVVGMSAAVLLVAGLLRVFLFEKGAAYYLHSAPFIAKFSLFVLAALLSIYPTVQFLSWRKDVQQNRTPSLDGSKLARLRMLVHLELAAILLLILNAALMAKGIGFFGGP